MDEKTVNSKARKRESEKERLARLLAFDAPYCAPGLLVGGMDEVGRGPLAGPVLACCLVLPENSAILGVNDSKKVSEKKRERLADEIKSAAVSVGIGAVDSADIDRLNILQATKWAFSRAVENMLVTPDCLLVDGIDSLLLPVKIQTIVHGDALSYRIAAASLVAKVARDKMMIAYDEMYPEYGFRKNKGYGTPEHIAALRAHGPCPIHRASFIKNFR